MSTTQSVEVITDKMEKTIERMGGTQCGADWCIAALDPFHDSAISDLRGFPDGACMKSVVEVVTSAATISCPSSITTGTWEAQIVNWNWLTSMVLIQGWLTGDSPIENNRAAPAFLMNGATNSLTTGGLSWTTGASNFSSVGGLASGQLNPASAYLLGNHRVIGQAFEVRSVGPALYRAGVSYLWRLPAGSPELAPIVNFIQQGASPVTANNKSYIIDAIPINITDAELIPDTVMLKAEEGCYVVSRMNSLEQSPTADPLVSPIIRYRLSTNNDSSNYPLSTAYGTGTLQSNGATVGANTWTGPGQPQVVQVSKMDLNGAIFTGLNPQDVLEVRVRWIIEKFPTLDEPTIMILATPSPQYDPIALEAYSRIIYRLPVGVPVRENGLGDWFRQAASSLGSIAGPILSMLPHPAAKAAGTAITAVSKAFKPPDSKQDAGKKLVAKLKPKVTATKPKAKKKK